MTTQDRQAHRAAGHGLRIRSILMALALLLASGFALSLPAVPAAAFPAGLLPGVAPGETWVVCQGYNNTGISHSGNLRYSLDITADLNGVGGGGCTGSATVTGGRSIVAPGSGVVAWNDGSGFCLNLDGGDSIKLYHVTGPRAGSRVTSGQVVGAVLPAGQGANGGYAHLHLAAYNGSGCPAGNGTPFTGAARLACAPDMSSNGSFNQWSGTRLTNSCGPTPISDGQFVSYQGHVYRIAGGAPIYVSSWDHVGGDPGTRALSDAEWNGLRQVPADGTYITGVTPGAAQNGSVYCIAGGAPIYVGSWDHVGGGRPTIPVDLTAVENAGGGPPWNHLRKYPADGTYIVGKAPGAALNGSVYRIAGGAPIYVSSWDHMSGAQPAVEVDLSAIDNADGAAPWNHLRQYPADGTYITGVNPSDPDHGTVYRMAGGGPVYVSSWENMGGIRPTVPVDLSAVQKASGPPPWNHMLYRPADGTILRAGSSTYKVIAGAPIAQQTAQAGTQVDPTAIAKAGQAGRWSHLAAPPPPPPPPAPVTPSTPSQPTQPAPGGAATVAAPTRVTATRVYFPRRQVAIMRWVAPANATSFQARVSRKRAHSKWSPWATVSSPAVKLSSLKRGKKYQVQIIPVGPGGSGPVTTWLFTQRR